MVGIDKDELIRVLRAAVVVLQWIITLLGG